MNLWTDHNYQVLKELPLSRVLSTYSICAWRSYPDPRSFETGKQLLKENKIQEAIALRPSPDHNMFSIFEVIAGKVDGTIVTSKILNEKYYFPDAKVFSINDARKLQPDDYEYGEKIVAYIERYDKEKAHYGSNFTPLILIQYPSGVFDWYYPKNNHICYSNSNEVKPLSFVAA